MKYLTLPVLALALCLGCEEDVFDNAEPPLAPDGTASNADDEGLGNDDDDRGATLGDDQVEFDEPDADPGIDLDTNPNSLGDDDDIDPLPLDGQEGAAGSDTVNCVLCGDHQFPVSESAGSERHAGKTYHFCSDHCHAKFKQNPAKYAAG